jgi:hypothetical protein
MQHMLPPLATYCIEQNWCRKPGCTPWHASRQRHPCNTPTLSALVKEPLATGKRQQGRACKQCINCLKPRSKQKCLNPIPRADPGATPDQVIPEIEIQTVTSTAVNPPSRTSAWLQASARTASTEQRGPGITHVKFLQGTNLNDGKGPLIPTRTKGPASEMRRPKRQRAQQQVEFNSCWMPTSWTPSKWELAKPTTDSVRLCLEQVMPGGIQTSARGNSNARVARYAPKHRQYAEARHWHRQKRGT